jgi:hypothetical protein
MVRRNAVAGPFGGAAFVASLMVAAVRLDLSTAYATPLPQAYEASSLSR